MIKVKVEGVPELKRFLKTKDANILKQIKTGLTKASVFLQGEVKSSIAGQRSEAKSVDTGRFLNSVGFQVTNLNGFVFSKIPYAGKLEYGTNFKNSPRKHFRNSASRSKQKINQLLQNSINKI